MEKGLRLGLVVGGSLEVLQGLKLFLPRGIVPGDRGRQYEDRHTACFSFWKEGKNIRQKTVNFYFFNFAFLFFL